MDGGDGVRNQNQQHNRNQQQNRNLELEYQVRYLEVELQREKKWRFISLILFIILIIVICLHIYNRITLNKEYIECYANEKNHTTVITTLDSQLKQCKVNNEKEQKKCEKDILEIEIKKDTLSNEIVKFQSSSIDCKTELKYCKQYYHDCTNKLQEEQTARKDLEKTFNNATLECSKDKKILENNIRNIENKRDDCEIRAKGKEQCQEDLHECNRKTCYIV